MKRIQKVAIANVIICLLTFISTAVACLVLHYYGKNPIAGVSAFAIFGFTGFVSLLFKKDDEPCDERDRKIHKDAAMAGFAIAYGTGGLGGMVPFLYSLYFAPQGAETKIGIFWLPVLAGAMGVCHCFAYSLAILIGYGRDKGDDDE